MDTGNGSESKPGSILDLDGDGISNLDLSVNGKVISGDNCPNTYNPDQIDTDDDGIGDVCDPTISGPNPTSITLSTNKQSYLQTESIMVTGTVNGIDESIDITLEFIGPSGTVVKTHEFPTSNDGRFWPSYRMDSIFLDGFGAYQIIASSGSVSNQITFKIKDSLPQILDSDKDSVPDSIDNCPDIPNTNQLDSDGNGIGDICDSTSQNPTILRIINDLFDEGGADKFNQIIRVRIGSSMNSVVNDSTRTFMTV